MCPCVTTPLSHRWPGATPPAVQVGDGPNGAVDGAAPAAVRMPGAVSGAMYGNAQSLPARSVALPGPAVRLPHGSAAGHCCAGDVHTPLAPKPRWALKTGYPEPLRTSSHSGYTGLRLIGADSALSLGMKSTS